ncbi:hypothetical protein MRX96_054441 [Rhipicephalus microplus]
MGTIVCAVVIQAGLYMLLKSHLSHFGDLANLFGEAIIGRKRHTRRDVGRSSVETQSSQRRSRVASERNRSSIAVWVIYDLELGPLRDRRSILGDNSRIRRFSVTAHTLALITMRFSSALDFYGALAIGAKDRRAICEYTGRLTQTREYAETPTENTCCLARSSA